MQHRLRCDLGRSVFCWVHKVEFLQVNAPRMELEEDFFGKVGLQEHWTCSQKAWHQVWCGQSLAFELDGTQSPPLSNSHHNPCGDEIGTRIEMFRQPLKP